MIRKLLHWLRLLIEPDKAIMDGTGRWRVRYNPTASMPGCTSIRMSYRQACDYASMFDGTVERAS